jgi:hexosaminidase
MFIFFNVCTNHKLKQYFYIRIPTRNDCYMKYFKLYYRSTRLYIIQLISVLVLGFSNYVPAQTTVMPGDFKVKAFHVDLRIQVMQLNALKKLAYQLHTQGINTLIIEWEGAYPYKDEAIISNNYAYKRTDLVQFINYCHSIQMDVIPLQQTFGHVEYILKHYKFTALREDQKDFSQVCPTELDSCRDLFTKLLSDVAEMHQSPYIHIGGDETFLLGHCEKCQRKVAKVGLSGLYFDYIKMICDIVVGLGKRPVLWADIALHYPEKIKLLPKQTIFVDWNYGWDLSYFGDHTQLLNSGYEVWGAPAIRSEPDNFYLERWKKHFENIRDFIPEMRQLNYQGAVMTSWSTSGAYSTVFDSNDDPIALYPVRRVYPLSGFNLLIEAYTTALNSKEPLAISPFIQHYAINHYALKKESAQQFESALFMAPYAVVRGKPESQKEMSLSELTDSAAAALEILKSLSPKRNVEEYQHYVLMADIRYYYLRTLKIEASMNSAAFTRKSAVKYLGELNILKQTSYRIDKQFAQLNRSFLSNDELKEEQELRNAKLNSLLSQVRALGK